MDLMTGCWSSSDISKGHSPGQAWPSQHPNVREYQYQELSKPRDSEIHPIIFLSSRDSQLVCMFKAKHTSLASFNADVKLPQSLPPLSYEECLVPLRGQSAVKLQAESLVPCIQAYSWQVWLSLSSQKDSDLSEFVPWSSFHGLLHSQRALLSAPAFLLNQPCLIGSTNGLEESRSGTTNIKILPKCFY